MVAGMGLMVGLVTSRFLKASSERRYESSQGNQYRRTYHGDRSAGVGAAATGRELSTGG
jgi:hypothetical protein